MDKLFFLQNTDEPLYVQLYQAITADIQSGDLKPDERMPSIRQLSKAMNLSRTTVETTYSQLVAEGYLYSKPQRGYFVMPLEVLKIKDEEGDNLEGKVSGSKKHTHFYDFVSEYVEPENFDMHMWRRNLSHVMLNQEQELFSFSNPFGEESLKEEIASYFTRVRNIRAEKEQIIIGAGTQNLLRFLSTLLGDKGYRRLNLEDPGFQLAKDAFEQNGFKIKGIRLKEKVLDVDKLDDSPRQVVFTSPSYQFPYGEIMPISTRYSLLNWADQSESYIIEDDYNNELRYIGKPIPSLQGMDPHDRVIYLGSFSTLLIPSIRISFLVLPKTLVNDYYSRFAGRVQSASKLEQLALAQMIRCGDFGKHIRKLRKAYRVKQQMLESLCSSYLDGVAGFEVPTAGTSAIISLKHTILRSRLEDESRNLGVLLGTLSDLEMGKKLKKLEKTLVLNYRGIRTNDLEEGIKKVRELICRLY